MGNSYDLPDATEIKPPPASVASRTTVAPSNSATNNTNRTRPPVTRPVQPYRGAQTTFSNTAKAPTTPPASVQKPGKSLGSTFTARQFASNDNNNTHLNDVSNKPLTTPVRSQVVPQRRVPTTQSSVEQIPPSTSSMDMTSNGQTSIPRSASSLSQGGRRSGIPTIGKQQRPSIPTATR